jgi:D-3-phosphoglycerate dehydrogenase
MKVLATPPYFDEAAKELNGLAEVELSWEKIGRFRRFTEEEFLSELPKYDSVIVWIDPLRRNVIESVRDKLKVIGVPRAGYDNVDVESATEFGIPVIYSPGANSIAVADYVFGFLLSLNRGIVKANNLLKSGNWKQPWAMLPGYNLEGKTIGIIGLGNIGVRVAIRAQCFGMKIMAYDPYLTDDTMTSTMLFPRELGVELVDLDTILKESDFITIHAPITKKTIHMIGKKEFDLMKPTTFIINTSRGGILDEDALYKALCKKEIAGAALDVYEKEPPAKNHPLFQFDNVIVTPHIAWCTHESMKRSNIIVAKEIKKVLENRLPNPKFLANPQVLRIKNR